MWWRRGAPVWALHTPSLHTQTLAIPKPCCFRGDATSILWGPWEWSHHQQSEKAFLEIKKTPSCPIILKKLLATCDLGVRVDGYLPQGFSLIPNPPSLCLSPLKWELSSWCSVFQVGLNADCPSPLVKTKSLWDAAWGYCSILRCAFTCSLVFARSPLPCDLSEGTFLTIGLFWWKWGR